MIVLYNNGEPSNFSSFDIKLSEPYRVLHGTVCRFVSTGNDVESRISINKSLFL